MLIITGLTGYVGSKLKKELLKQNIDFIYTKRNNKNSYSFFDKSNKKVSLNHYFNFEFTLIHLATYFSKNKNEDERIKDANIVFGSKIFNQMLNYNLVKIIYTNTMYAFYPNSEIQNLIYTQSKTDFSNYLKKESKLRNIAYEEIFLDNTFGGNDERDKIIPKIINSIVKKEANPIQNTENFINLIHVDNVVERILKNLYVLDNSSSSFISDKSVNLNSIYEYLLYFDSNNEINFELLIFDENNYIANYPLINLADVKLFDIRKSLIEELIASKLNFGTNI